MIPLPTVIVAPISLISTIVTIIMSILIPTSTIPNIMNNWIKKWNK